MVTLVPMVRLKAHPTKTTPLGAPSGAPPATDPCPSRASGDVGWIPTAARLATDGSARNLNAPLGFNFFSDQRSYII